MRQHLIPILLTSILAATLAHAAESKVTSPDGTISLTVSDTGGLAYRLEMDNKPVLIHSRLGLVFEKNLRLGDSAKIEKATPSSHDTTWENRFGKRRIVRDQYNEMRLELAEGDRRFALLVRMHNDGIAFRYDLPDQSNLGTFTLTDELTEFAFPDNYRCWGGEYSSCAENNYPECRLNSIRKASVLPLLVELPHGYAAIAESDLIDWAGMFIAGSSDPKGTTLKVDLAQRKDGHGRVVSKTPRLTPWRVVMLGRKAADLINSDLIANLATPSQIADVSWIKPGVAAWDPWWAKSVGTRGTTETDRPYIDLAAAMGWQYQLVDWGWCKKNDVTAPSGKVDIFALRDYAKQKNVQLLLWMHSEELNHTGIEKAFATVASWGIPGVKIDFMNSDSQETVQWYYTTLQAAAQHKLLVDFHGAYKPTGLARTWPNYITQEGVLGNEYNKLNGRKCTPLHNITLPFTRGLLGPMDFTPGGFANRTAKDFVQDAGAKPNGNCHVIGSRARQLSMTVLYESPLMCMADSPQSYLGQPGVEFLRAIPTVWDDTVVLTADVCRHVVLARRSGKNWYLVGMNADEPLTLKVPMNFLSSGSWTLRSFADTPESATKPESIHESTRTIPSSQILEIQMAPAGGFAAILSPAP